MTSSSSAAKITRPDRWRKRSQCFNRLEQRLKQLLPDVSDHASMVGAGHRDQRRTALHRRARRAAVRGDRIRGERHDVRHGLGHDVRRSRDEATPIRGPSCSIRAARRSRAACGITSRKTRTTRTTSSAIGLPGKAGTRCDRSNAAPARSSTSTDKPAAVYRGLDGQIHVRSAVCTHMGCYVSWNDAERTWDCPCHGSRFKVNGEVLAGPAEDPLAPIELSRRTETSSQARD